MQHQKVSGQGIDLSEGEEAGLPSQTTQARRDKRRRRQQARRGGWEGGGRAGEEEGGESRRQRQEQASERGGQGERRMQRLELENAPGTQRVKHWLQGDEEEGDSDKRGQGTSIRWGEAGPERKDRGSSARGWDC